MEQLSEVQRNIQTSLNDQQQLFSGLHQNQTLGKLQFDVFQCIVIKISVSSVFLLSRCYEHVLETNAALNWLIDCSSLICLWMNRAVLVFMWMNRHYNHQEWCTTVAEKHMQTSLNDQRQLVRELHQNQSVGTSQILADGSLLIIVLILTRNRPTGTTTRTKIWSTTFK